MRRIIKLSPYYVTALISPACLWLAMLLLVLDPILMKSFSQIFLVIGTSTIPLTIYSFYKMAEKIK
jgi:hypothetical protein